MRKMNIHLEKISWDNYYQVLKLKVTKEQDNYVASNKASLIHAFLEVSEGTPVYACKSGEVLSASNDSTYGNFIILQHENNMQSVYAHLSKIAVSEGYVRSGTIIGYVGTTGLSTGPHLHFEIRTNGKNRDPKDYLP